MAPHIIASEKDKKKYLRNSLVANYVLFNLLTFNHKQLF